MAGGEILQYSEVQIYASSMQGFEILAKLVYVSFQKFKAWLGISGCGIRFELLKFLKIIQLNRSYAVEFLEEKLLPVPELVEGNSKPLPELVEGNSTSHRR